MTIGVVIATYNAADFLDQTLASVAAQSLRPDEVVIADDCSSDDTVSAARRWDGLLPLRIVELGENVGPAGARAAAIATTATDLVALLDADDYWLPDHLAVLLAAHEPGTVVTADPLRWMPESKVPLTVWSSRSHLPAPGRQLRQLLQENFLFVGSLFERALYERVGGFRLPFRGTEDWDLWIRMVRAGAVVVRAPKPTVLYRLGRTSISAGSGMRSQEVAVLERAAIEAATTEEHRWAKQSLRRHVAREALARSYLAASDHRLRHARRLALSVFSGSEPRYMLRALATLVAPTLASRAHDRLREVDTWWIRH